MDAPTCATCRFWKPERAHTAECEGFGICHADPRAVTEENYGAWPGTLGLDSCERHAPAKVDWLDQPIGVVSRVRPDGGAEVELNDAGKAFYGPNMRVVLVPPPTPPPS